MTLDAGELEDEARHQTGLDDFGDTMFRDGLERLVRSFNEEADLTEAGEVMQHVRLVSLLSSRLQVEDTYRIAPGDRRRGNRRTRLRHREVAPDDGTAPALEPARGEPTHKFRSFRLWSPSTAPAARDRRPRHRSADRRRPKPDLPDDERDVPADGSMHHEEARRPTECQDLLGMSFRTVHFDGFAHVPSYLAWVGRLRHARTRTSTTAVFSHFAAVALPAAAVASEDAGAHVRVGAHPRRVSGRQFPWSHRDPAKVLPSVCSLIHYTGSWATDRDDWLELGAEQLDRWWTAVSWAMEFRTRVGDERFADLSFVDLQSDPVGALGSALDHIGIGFPRASLRRSRGLGRVTRARLARPALLRPGGLWSGGRPGARAFSRSYLDTVLMRCDVAARGPLKEA